ncbi:MAG: hypothetical protein M3094_09540 [Actinomycetia bacterium]|nr:hypothetical protein [Actinomycetes bacterium]
MTTQRERIPVTRLTCVGCDCGACVTEAVAKIGMRSGVLYVGIDRFLPGFVVRFDDDLEDLDTIRSLIAEARIELADVAAAG